MNTIIKWAAKSYAKSFINNVLDAHKDSVGASKVLVLRVIEKVEKVLVFLRSLLKKLDDNIIDDTEVDEILDESTTLMKEVIG